MRKLSKKAIMFTVLAVLISALVLSAFFTYHSVAIDVNVDNSKMRIQGINRYITQLDVYMANMLTVTGSNNLVFLSSIMIGNNSYMDNYTAEFESCMLDDTIKPPWSGGVLNCPESTYFVGKVSYLQGFSRSKLNINPNITVNSLVLEQNGPWRLVLILNYTVKINDSYASWEVTKVINQNLSIVGVPDPTYMIVDPSLASERYALNISPYYSDYWSEKPSALHNATLQKKYFAWPGAPSFLDRMNNNMTPSPFGIASIVSPDFITNKSLLEGKCNLDFMFWKNLSLGNPADYGRYDFWAPGVYPIDRFNYQIDETNPGLNGTIIPLAVMSQFNMSDPKYINLTIT